MSRKRPPAASRQRFWQEELFVHYYVKHMGNATAAARDAFGIENDAYAAKRGSEMVRKSKVQELLHQHMEAQRAQFQQFVEQGPYYLTIIAERLCKIIQDDKTPFDDLMRAIETLARFAGRDLSEKVAIAEVQATATRPVPADIPQQRPDVQRKVLFMLSPPPMRSGGVPPPALEKQWREMGWSPDWKQGYEEG